MNSPFFDQSKMAVTANQFVAWLDVMGTASTLQRSLPQAANFVCKLHSSCLNHLPPSGVTYYPMNDGAYLVGGHREVLETVGAVLNETAILFMTEADGLQRYMIRGALAFGDVVHGHSAKKGLHRNQPTKEMVGRVLLGNPTAVAHRGEGMASPFGLYVDQSARRMNRLMSPLYRWWLAPHFKTCVANKTFLVRKIEDHIDWCLAHPIQTSYKRDRADEHRVLAREYFE